MYPRVLVISNNCFSKTDSNGRTLGSFFCMWPQEKLAQFYIQNVEPDFSYCKNFYRVTDREVLGTFIGKKAGIVISEQLFNEGVLNKSRKVTSKKHARNSLTMLFRHLIWSFGYWKNDGFSKWVTDYSPELIVFQAGDSPFMYHIAVAISKEYHAKLLIYNSEGYFFKDYDYFKSAGFSHIIYPLFISILRKKIRKAYSNAQYVIYSCEELERAYNQEFSIPSDTIYTATMFNRNDKNTEPNTVFTISYAGNLGVGRAASIVEFAEVVRKLEPTGCLNVYGSLPNSKVKAAFDQCQNIHFKGFVPYEEVVDALKRSDLVIHVESFDNFYREDLKFAFSTKIADALACGTCFLLYAPESFACSKYLKTYEAAYVATNKDTLEMFLRQIVDSPAARKRFLQNAIDTVTKNHESKTNCEKFFRIITEVMA